MYHIWLNDDDDDDLIEIDCFDTIFTFKNFRNAESFFASHANFANGYINDCEHGKPCKCDEGIKSFRILRADLYWKNHKSPFLLQQWNLFISSAIWLSKRLHKYRRRREKHITFFPIQSECFEMQQALFPRIISFMHVRALSTYRYFMWMDMK